VHYKGPKSSSVYSIPRAFEVNVQKDFLTLTPRKETMQAMKLRDVNREWGMHRALLANALSGAKKEFEKVVEIVGLGYKAVKSGDMLVFTLGYSHKIDFKVPKGVTVSIDKTGQKLTVSSIDKVVLGEVCSKMCDLRLPEPYKG